RSPALPDPVKPRHQPGAQRASIDAVLRSAQMLVIGAMGFFLGGCAARDGFGASNDDSSESSGVGGGAVGSPASSGSGSTSVTSTGSGPASSTSSTSGTGGGMAGGTMGIVVIDVQETFVTGSSTPDMPGIIDRTKNDFQIAQNMNIPFFITYE